MDMNTFNVSATLNIFRLIARPTLCLPHATISTFNQLPIPLNQAFGGTRKDGRHIDIRAVVLDKDNCFAYPNKNEVHKPYEVGFIFRGIIKFGLAAYYTPVVGYIHIRVSGGYHITYFENYRAFQFPISLCPLHLSKLISLLYHHPNKTCSPTSTSSAPPTQATDS
jgi:Mitochondrial PGP phosphatase